MFDSALRPLIDPPLNALGRWLARIPISADQVTLAGLALGLAAALAIFAEFYGLALGLILLSRLADGLDGAIARASQMSAFGGFLDITCDFAFYAAVPLAFGLARPENQVPALLLLASFILSGVSFLAGAIIAAQRQWQSEAQGKKSFFYLAGWMEGGETIAFFIAFCLLPDWFGWLALPFAVLCVLTAIGRALALRARLAGAP